MRSCRRGVTGRTLPVGVLCACRGPYLLAVRDERGGDQSHHIRRRNVSFSILCRSPGRTGLFTTYSRKHRRSCYGRVIGHDVPYHQLWSYQAHEFSVSCEAMPANTCKRLSKRRLFARGAIAPLGRSTRGGGTPHRRSSSRWAGGVPPSTVAVRGRFAIYATVVSRTSAHDSIPAAP